MHTQDTIVAISTPLGRGGLGVLPLSGPAARAIAERILRFHADPTWRTWHSQLAHLADIDEVEVTFFAAPGWYPAEDVVELSCHGSPVVWRLALEREMEAGARLA